MNALNKILLASAVLLFTAPASAAAPASLEPQGFEAGLGVGSPPRPISKAERYARRCQSRAPYRGSMPQGTQLWGTKESWLSRQGSSGQRSVLVSASLDNPLHVEGAVQSVRLEKGRLVAWPDAALSLTGTVLQGTSSDGEPVEVALCGAEPVPGDPEQLWYRIEAWNPVAQEWENPCATTAQMPDPRAMMVAGEWDGSGAHHEAPGKITLACESGVISKCIRMGYKPWAEHNGQPLAGLHQACTRMARADYCGNGRSHTREGTVIDIYDALGMLSVTTVASAMWDPERASFEAAWAPDGAACLARTRDGRALETILQECPGRFTAGAPVELGAGDRCTARRADVSAEKALLRNRIN